QAGAPRKLHHQDLLHRIGISRRRPLHADSRRSRPDDGPADSQDVEGLAKLHDHGGRRRGDAVGAGPRNIQDVPLTPRSNEMPFMTSILKKIRVIETANFVSGPYVGQLLADLGAEVIKI